jgi:hypothetical protein
VDVWAGADVAPQSSAAPARHAGERSCSATVDLAAAHVPRVAHHPLPGLRRENRLEENRVLGFGEVVQALHLDGALPGDVGVEELLERLLPRTMCGGGVSRTSNGEISTASCVYWSSIIWSILLA